MKIFSICSDYNDHYDTILIKDIYGIFVYVYYVKVSRETHTCILEKAMLKRLELSSGVRHANTLH